MPDIIAHYRFGAQVLELVSPEVRAALAQDLFDHATAGPDIWFSYRFWLPPAQKGRPGRGNWMQHKKTGAFLCALAQEARFSPARRELFSYWAGFICHYCLDKATHPYIIYCSGEYDGTPATRQNRGSHMYLEHALDLRALRLWGLSLSGRPVLRRILRLKRLPRSMRPGLDAAYRQVYGWEDAWRELNRGLWDQRLFYLLAQDPHGWLDRVLCRIDNGVSRRDLTAISYYGKEQSGVDVGNEACQPWQHPRDSSLVFQASFDQLAQQAAREAAAMLAAGWTYLNAGGEEALASALGDASYETGFPWQDPRNEAPLHCQPLPLQKRSQRKG